MLFLGRGIFYGVGIKDGDAEKAIANQDSEGVAFMKGVISFFRDCKRFLAVVVQEYVCSIYIIRGATGVYPPAYTFAMVVGLTVEFADYGFLMYRLLPPLHHEVYEIKKE